MSESRKEIECLSGQHPVQLANNYVCNAGFFCPNNSDTRPPVYCHPTRECQIRRLLEFYNLCTEPQGIYEPLVCPPGYYCPSGEEMIPCPQGHFCPVGTVDPIRCMTLSVCPERSEKEVPLVGFLCLGLVDLILVIALWRRHIISLWNFLWRHIDPKQTISSAVFPLQRCGKEPVLPRDTSKHANSSEDLVITPRHQQTSQGGANGLQVDFRQLSLYLKDIKRPILCGISGKVKRGSLLGVLGPSGAGKCMYGPVYHVCYPMHTYSPEASLVRILAGRASATSGVVTYNGVRGNPLIYKYAIGFVPQDDIILPNLTVYENIVHSARIRLCGSQNTKMLDERVSDILHSLGLTHVQHSLVGSLEKRGISGGERKRVNIALEMIGAPLALILDEPTSGLDSTTALSLMKQVKQISLSGITVICVLHQPRTDIFDLLDDVLLLSSGKQVYMGEATMMRKYFEGLGYELPRGPNFADMILDAIYSDPNRLPWSPSQNQGSFNAEVELESHTQGQPTETDGLQKQLALALRISMAQRASWVYQAFLCFHRSLLQQVRQPLTYIIENIVGSSCGTLIGLAVYKYNGHLFHGLFMTPFEPLSSATNYGLIPELALLSCLAITLSAAPASVETFSGDKLVIRQEQQSGHSITAYFVGKDLSTIPRIILSSLHFTAFYATLATPIIPFSTLFLSNTLYFYCMYGLAAAVSLAARREHALLTSLLGCLVVCIMNGYGPALIYVKEWNMEWLWFLCPGTWLAEAWTTEHTKPLAHLYNLQAFADTTGYTIGRTGFDLGMLFMFGMIYRLIGFIGLFMSDPENFSAVPKRIWIRAFHALHSTHMAIFKPRNRNMHRE